MQNRNHYIEPLISIIELNDDKSWLEAFLNLRAGGYLPGGGAGSLNDWGPSYADPTAQSWFSNLYSILRYLCDGDLAPESIIDFKPIKTRNKIRVIRCLNCNNGYQHPSVFESHIALDFYHTHFVTLLANKLWMNLFVPVETYAHPEIKEFRDSLTRHYAQHNIKIADFVNNQYQCPHCGKAHAETEHDLYVLRKESQVSLALELVKSNATWKDFE